jgi:hypothetical protein
MSYSYVLTRLKDPKEINKPDYSWTENVLNWATSLQEVKDKLTEIYPSAKNQWEEWKSQGEGESEIYIWGQIPSGPRFEFTIHLQPFPWLSVHTTDSEEVIRLGQRLGLSVLDVQAGKWIYVQDTFS